MVLFCCIETSSLGPRSFIVFEASSRRNSEVPSFDVDGGQSGTHGTARRKKVAHRSSRCLQRVVRGWEGNFLHQFAIHFKDQLVVEALFCFLQLGVDFTERQTSGLIGSLSRLRYKIEACSDSKLQSVDATLSCNIGCLAT